MAARQRRPGRQARTAARADTGRLPDLTVWLPIRLMSLDVPAPACVLIV